MKVCFAIIFLLLNLSVYAQSSFVENVIAPLQEGYIFFEKVFVHTNKNIYLLDDVIWFKAYVGNKDNNPSSVTTRLYISLVNANGEIIFSKNFFVHEGTGKGQFELNNAVAPGKYYIQAYTNYMRNFGENSHFLQEINIVGNEIPRGNPEDYEFKVFPEGGSLLEGRKNVVVIKPLVSGEDVDFSGKIINSKNKEIIDFENQHMGMAKSSFFYEPGEEYKAIINISGKTIKVEIPAAKSQGMVLSLDNSKKDTLSLSLRTNKNTVDSLENFNYTLLYHQRNKILGFLQISKLDSLNALINSDKNVFYEGVNTVTLFKGQQPIAARKFFIEKGNQGMETSLSVVSTKGDSITYRLYLQKDNTPIKGNISVSVIAPGANNFQRVQNIKSAFLLAPYINGYIENPAYYFDKENIERKKHLDLLLLTQTWSQDSLEKMINDLNPRPKFDFEFGFDLKGEIVPPFGSNQLALISNENKVIEKLFLNGDKEFLFEKLLLYKGDTIKVAFLDNEGKAIRPKRIHFDSVVNKTHPTIKLPYSNIVENEKGVKRKTEENWLSLDAIELDEVLLTSKKRSESYLRRRELIEKYKPLVWDIGKYYELRLPESYKDFNNDLWSYLRFDQHVQLKNWKGIEYYLEVPIKKEALIYINGEPVKNVELLGLSSIDMDDVENIMVQPVKGNRVYQVFTTENHQNNIEELAVEYVMEHGYDRPKKYYSPYYDFNRAGNKNFTEVDWKPEVRTNGKGEAFITISKEQATGNLLFSIQGFTEEGFLISEIVNK